MDSPMADNGRRAEQNAMKPRSVGSNLGEPTHSVILPTLALVQEFRIPEIPCPLSHPVLRHPVAGGTGQASLIIPRFSPL